MNRTRTRTALVTAAVAGGAGVLLLATPVLAVNGPNGPDGRPGNRVAATSTCPTVGTDAGSGFRDGRGPGRPGGAGHGMRNRGPTGGSAAGGMLGDPARNLPASGTLTPDQRTSLAAMAEEEKLAHDVYTALATATGDARFTRVAAAEGRHLDAVRVLMTRNAVADPTTGTAVGEFTTAAVQDSYDTLVARGRASLDAALAVGRTIETTDVADLETAMTGLDAPDVTTLYQRLSAASQHHLAAFGG